MEVSPLLQRLVDRARLPVMMRAALQRTFDAATLDRWFETVAQQRYTKKLLFSTLFELMTQVVLRQSGSMRAARAIRPPSLRSSDTMIPAGPMSRSPSCWRLRGRSHLEITPF